MLENGKVPTSFDEKFPIKSTETFCENNQLSEGFTENNHLRSEQRCAEEK
jgi:hypothetical protein